jgi:polyisoprenoid-binding protein YceI
MKKLIVTAASILASNFMFAQGWGMDRSHSSVKFSISHMVVSEVQGSFRKFTGTLTSEKDDFTDAKIDFTIDVNSIDTDEPQRDGHLKSADFFDVAANPSINFKSKSFTKVGANKYKLTGDLTMHGVTKPYSFDVTNGGTIKDPYGNKRTGFKVVGNINRYDFGLKYNAVLEAGGLTIGETLDFVSYVEFTKK